MYQINRQAPVPRDHREDGSLDVHSYFHTIQGEGPFAGEAAFFIRLVGCNLQCPGCDTEYTNQSNRYSPEDLFKLVLLSGRTQGDLIVITGGEPFRQNITPAVLLLVDGGYSVQIETNGVLYPGDHFPWEDENVTVVCSPKTGKIHPTTAALVDAYKYVLHADDVDEDGLPIHALGHPLGNFKHVARPPAGWYGPVFLQPMDVLDPVENSRNVQAVVASVMRHRRYIMGVQMHKLTGLP